jgi:EAL domain-containing protein (putative c-di-GMP-specific phosphodiesterase class I)
MSSVARPTRKLSVRHSDPAHQTDFPARGQAVNVSAAQFDAPDFVQEVRAALVESAVPPAALTYRTDRRQARKPTISIVGPGPNG